MAEFRYNPFSGLLEIPSVQQLAGGTIVPTAFGIQLLTAADAAAAVALLGVEATGVISVDVVSNSSSLTATGGPITGTGTFTFTLDATLQAIGTLNPTADTIIYATGTNTFSTTALTSTARSLLDDASTSAMRTTLGLAIGTNVQAWSADLDSFVTNASWSGSTLTLAGDLQLGGGLNVGSQFLITKNTSTGIQIFTVEANAVTLLDVVDTGEITITAAASFVGNVFTVAHGSSGDLFVIEDTGTATFTQGVVAAQFTGNGSTITDLNGSQITMGTVPNARLDSDLQALANNSGSGLWARTGAGTGSVRTITGTANKIDVSDGTGVGGNPTITISGSYVGQTSITTLGTIGTGVWNGTAIGTAYGGLGANNSAATGVPVFAAGTATVSASPSLTNLTLSGNLIVATQTPASAAATGTAGTIAWDSSYIYVCVATDTWKRVAISTW